MSKAKATNKNLVILTTHFGTNFSGGSTATHEIFVKLEDEFDRIIIVCNKIGQNKFKNVEFKLYNSFWGAFRILMSIDNKDTIFYGDFYNSILLIWAKKKFYFTYHDNWPEMKYTSDIDRIRSFFYIPVYKTIFRSAQEVVAVSKHKMRYIEKFTHNVKLVYNGYRMDEIVEQRKLRPRKRILMVGNIDKRKYRIALKLFSLLGPDFEAKIDIFGNKKDKQLAEKLNSFPFVRLQGFVQSIPYQDYSCMLHTSLIENLPIAICESIYYGIPVVTFDVGGICEVVNNTNGILISPFDLVCMKASLESIISGEKEFSFKDNNLTNFDWGIASTKYLKILK